MLKNAKLKNILTIAVISIFFLFIVSFLNACKETTPVEETIPMEKALEEKIEVEVAGEETEEILEEVQEEEVNGESTEETEKQESEDIGSVEPYEIEIIGDNDFIKKTKEALDLLENKAPIHFGIVTRYIGAIEWVEEGSGMFAWEDPPLYKVGEATVEAGTIWYAGTIVHDSIHSKQYHDYLAENPTSSVPDEVWTGKSAEAQCLDAQYDALEKIGADQATLDYIEDILETEYWEVEYEERWW